MFKIKWRSKRLWDRTVKTGLSLYPSIEAANEQVRKWEAIFRIPSWLTFANRCNNMKPSTETEPLNHYYVVPA